MFKRGLVAYFSALFSAACSPNYIPPPNLPSSVTQISTPHETKEWLQEVLTYKYDEELYKVDDFWAPCALTYKNKAGDCDDYAICAAALLQGDVEQGYIVTISNDTDGHAGFLYRLQGKWGVISNNKKEYREPEFSSFHAAVYSSFGERYNKYSIYDYSGVDIVNGFENLEEKLTPIGKYRMP